MIATSGQVLINGLSGNWDSAQEPVTEKADFSGFITETMSLP
jgi:hypothetical protein